MPAVSVLVPNYNHRAYLDDRLGSIFSQEFQDYEVILLDDASSDGSVEFLEQFQGHPKVSGALFNVHNSGSTFTQWNKAVEAARGEYIWIAESDDRADSKFLSTLVPLLQADSARVLAYCQSWRIDQHGARVGDWRGWTRSLSADLFDKDFEMGGGEFISRLLLHKNVIPNASAVVFRREAYLSCGQANTGVRYCGDWLVWLRLALQGKVYFHAGMLNEFRQHNKSVIAGRVANKCDVFNKKYDISMRLAFSDFLGTSFCSVYNELQEKNLKLIRGEAEREAWLLIKYFQFEDADEYLRIASDGVSVKKRIQLFIRAARKKFRARLRQALV